MNHFLIGQDLKAKDETILRLRNAVIKDPAHLNFDCDQLDAQSLPPEALRKALVTLPLFAERRLVIVRNAHKIKPADAATLLDFLAHPAAHVDVILEAEAPPSKGDMKTVVGFCQVIAFDHAPGANVFDMTKLVASGKIKEALKMLNEFYAQGQHPLQVMGALTWFWGKEGRRLSRQDFEKGLRALEEADVNIKRSRMDANYCVEKVVVELGALFDPVALKN